MTPRAEGGGRTAEGGGRTAEGGGRTAEGGGRTADGGGRTADGGGLKANADSQWPLWEIFLAPGGGAPHEHVGSLHAVDAEQALQNARDVYTRRGEGNNIWVVPTAVITASTPEDMGPFFEPGNDKPYRHPQFYKVPRGVKM